MRVLIFGLSIFAFTLAACTGAATEAPSSGPLPTEPVEIAEPAQAAIQLGALSLNWEEIQVGEGIKPAFAIDADGTAHITMLTEADHGGLFYANNASGDFQIETIAEGYFYGPIDLALNQSGEPFIAYHDHQALRVDMELGDAVVAHLAEGGWVLTTVDDDGHDGWDNSIAVDSEGLWHAAAIEPSQFGFENGVEYATLVDGTVQVSPVGSGPVKYEFGTSVALDPSGSPSVAYYNDRVEQLELSSLGADGWTVEVVDDNSDAGRYASLVFAPDGTPHIAYYVAETNESGTVRHAWKDAGGWQAEDVGTLQNLRMGQIGARKITSLAFGPDGSLHLAYTDRDQLIYAQMTNEGWIGQDVLEPGSRDLGQLVELVIDSDGNPHLVWYEAISRSPSLQGIVLYAVGK